MVKKREDNLMKGKVYTLILFLSFFVCFILNPSNSFSLSYYVFDDWGGTYHDTEKNPTNSEDDLMCWAASVSNILAWTGWGNVPGESFLNADDIFYYYQDHWTDQGGHVYYGLDWWFDGTNDSQGSAGWSQVDVSGGGFWGNESFSDYYLYSASDYWAIANITYLLEHGYGTSLGVTDDSSAHAITAWGYEFDAIGNFLGIWVTDSDDDKNSGDPQDYLAYYDVFYSGGSWYLQDFFGFDTWYITDVIGLSQAPTTTAHAPEPGTLVLFGFGLIGLTGFRRRFKN